MSKPLLVCCWFCLLLRNPLLAWREARELMAAPAPHARASSMRGASRLPACLARCAPPAPAYRPPCPASPAAPPPPRPPAPAPGALPRNAATCVRRQGGAAWAGRAAHAKRLRAVCAQGGEGWGRRSERAAGGGGRRGVRRPPRKEGIRRRRVARKPRGRNGAGRGGRVFGASTRMAAPLVCPGPPNASPAQPRLVRVPVLLLGRPLQLAQRDSRACKS